MQMGIDLAPLQRREILALLAAFGAAPVWAAKPRRATLLGAWQIKDEQHIGLLSVGDTQWSVQRSLMVPRRAHGLWAEAGGSVLAVARRPGDWLLRWQPRTGTTQWHWIDGDRRFNGHVIASSDGTTLWTTETDLDTAQGRLGMRDAASLEKTGEWSTHGMDPHQLLALPQPVGDLPAGTLMVANGGIPTLPETGRSKRELGRMDSSLVALHPGSGALLGQWRLRDPHLSIRHLAWDTTSRTLGVALQAEHPDKAAQAAAPVCAVWNGDSLRAAQDQPVLAGYGGDICALPGGGGGGFAVSCPRADRLALFSAQGVWQGAIAHAEACALAADRTHWWLASSRGGAGLLHGSRSDAASAHTRALHHKQAHALQMDNHWMLLSG
ncbi:MAG: DUF1513 domain-containing protein [Comamonadaceae bacterium]|nr:DUF1513 domain-containing protein [Comamonadaceae bacterium]